MIRVLEVSSDSNIGGAGKCILTFLKTFNRNKFEVAVVMPKGSLLKSETEKLDIKVYEAEHLAEKSFDFKAVFGLVKLFKELKPDIVHTHASMSARIAAKICGISIVYTRHSVFPPPKKLCGGIGKLINGFVNNHTADRIIAVAEAAKENITVTGVDPKKTEVILNGVEPLTAYDDSKKREIKEYFGICEGESVAVMAARMTEVKGHKYFVEAARILKEKGIKFKFIIAGTGDTEGEVKAQIKDLGLEEQVLMIGFAENVEPIMNIMDVQVNCSYGTEATSLSLLEGMSLGKPAVVTDFGGNPGVIQDGINGYLMPTHNSQILAECLEKLFCNKEAYEKMSRECKRIYGERFTADVYARAVERVYEELV